MTTDVVLRGELALLADLEAADTITPTGLRLLDETLPLDQWVALGGYLGRVRNITSWAIGDWMNFGEAVYGETYAQGIEATGLAYETLVNYASVCRNVAPSRRRADLSFSHHAEVAKLDPAGQVVWLDRAAREGLSRGELRALLRNELTEAAEAPPNADGERVAVEPLRAAAQDVVRYSERVGGSYRVPAEPMARLRAAIGGE